MANPTVIFINTRATLLESAPAFDAARRLGLEVVIVADRPVVAPNGLEVEVIEADTYDAGAVAAAVASIASGRDVRGVVGWRERDVEATAVGAAELGLPGHPVEVVRLVQDKALCREALKGESDFNIAHRYIAEGGPIDHEVLSFPLPAIVKPVGSSASRGIHLVSTTAELVDAIESVRRITQPDVDPIFRRFAGGVLIEEYIGGSEHSVEAIVEDGSLCLGHVTDKWVEPDHHMEYLQVHPSSLEQAVQEQMLVATERIVKTLGLGTGALHLEFRLASDGSPRLVEINARPGGNCITSHLVNLARRFDFIEAYIAVACGMELEAGGDAAHAFAGSRELLATRPGTFMGLSGLDVALANTSVRHFSVDRPLGSQVRLPPDSYTESVLATMICAGYSRDAVVADLDQAATALLPILESEG